MAIKHGTYTAYRHDRCRCEECRKANAATQKASRDRRRDNQEVHRARTGRDALKVPEHGTTASYTNFGCRCAECTAAQQVAHRASKAKQYDRRVIVDGRLVAAHIADDRHGDVHIYRYYGCRCIPCSIANREAAQTRKARTA